MGALKELFTGKSSIEKLEAAVDDAKREAEHAADELDRAEREDAANPSDLSWRKVESARRARDRAARRFADCEADVAAERQRQWKAAFQAEHEECERSLKMAGQLEATIAGDVERLVQLECEADAIVGRICEAIEAQRLASRRAEELVRKLGRSDSGAAAGNRSERTAALRRRAPQENRRGWSHAARVLVVRSRDLSTLQLKRKPEQ